MFLFFPGKQSNVTLQIERKLNKFGTSLELGVVIFEDLDSQKIMVKLKGIQLGLQFHV